MVPLGIGYYDFHFESSDDLRRIWSAGTVNLKPRLLHFSQWTKDFSRATQKQTHASIWLRLVELPQEYWRERTLKEIASTVGAPIDIDDPTRNRAFGHYARILVNVDLSKRAYDEILVEREGYTFKVKVQYKRRPLFCHHCYATGNNVTTCKWLHQEAITDVPDRGKKPVADVIPTGTAPLRQKWVPRRDAGASISSHMTDPPLATLHNQEQPIPADVVAPVHDNIAANSFSFSLQNVMDDIPQRRLPGPDIPVLELVSDGEHDDMHSRDVAHTQQVSPVAAS